jgi:hypothetical protein
MRRATAAAAEAPWSVADDVHEQVCARGYPGGSEHLTVVHVQDFRVYLD